MASVMSIAKDIVSSLDTDTSVLLAIKWIDNRYKELVSQVRFRHLRKIGEVVVAAAYSDGTAAVTRGSTAVTGTDTLWTTNVGSGDLEDWYIKLTSAWYKIESVDSQTGITLATAFSETTVTEATPVCVKRYNALDSSARWIGAFVFTRLRLSLGNAVSMEQLDREAPGRIFTGSHPHYVAQAPHSSDGYIRVEFYPYSSTSEILHYVYWDLPTELTIAGDIPAQIDPHMLKEGAMIDFYRYLKSAAYHTGNVNVGNSWRNDEFAQMTKWKSVIKDAKRTDRGTDDTTFVLDTLGGSSIQSGDIRNAHDMAYNRWSYPS